ncbi:MAG: thiamine biosynthesis protein ThiI-related adenine nucleotide alpha hydrolase superfamily protein [Geobacteraceae bacterium]|nr:thiamine biosynthesis protein ThiI-related adenine nucleotide alpha hydrolase superfamily protein [Geobacteraceae bacterium]
MQRKALALLSGGLDSTLAVKVMLEQGIQVEALNFTSPFCTCTGKNAGCKSEAVRVAQELDIPIKVMNKGLDYLEVVRKPKHGYGKGMNPCIDCRIFLLRKAKEYMAECGADFVITGEVLGQRPMSQRRNTLNLIERESGLEGLLLRPLSAGHFAPTIPEQEGWVDRSRLPAIQGRSRKEQMKLAEELDITNYPCPAGGCLLTEVSFVSKIRDVFDHCEQPAIRDFQLLKVGRHFRVGADTKVIIGRNEAENESLEKMVNSGEVCIRWFDGSGPMGIVTGESDDTLLQKAGKILLRYTKAIPGTECSLKVACEGGERIIPVINDFDDARLEEFRV